MMVENEGVVWRLYPENHGESEFLDGLFALMKNTQKGLLPIQIETVRRMPLRPAGHKKRVRETPQKMKTGVSLVKARL